MAFQALISQSGNMVIESGGVGLAFVTIDADVDIDRSES